MWFQNCFVPLLISFSEREYLLQLFSLFIIAFWMCGVSWWGEITLRLGVVKTITKLFTFILMVFLNFGFFCSRREMKFYVQNRGKQIFVKKIGDCVRLCFLLCFTCCLSLKDYTFLPCWPRLGHVTCLGQRNMSRSFNSHQWFSCALFALCHEFSYVQMGVFHQPGSYSKDDMSRASANL